MKRTLFSLLTLTLSLSLVGGCNGGVQHPTPGEPNEREVCARRPEGEMNCLACSSVPGCAWCGIPVTGSAQCQPGVSSEMASTCAGQWAQSSEECTKPPPPMPEETTGEPV